jgi:plastocyanin
MTALGTAQQNGSPAESFQFGGRVQGWQGRAPASIKGKKNPTLRLQTGQVYQVTWTNLDGQPHNFALRDSDGRNLKVIYPNVQTNMSGSGGTTSGGGGTSAGGGGSVQPPNNAIEQTKRVSKKGATQTLRFVATKDIEHYVCTVHPTTMIGKVETSGERGSGGGSGDHGGGTDHNGGSGDHGGNDDE